MPLIKCPACGREISSEADACPQCGHPNPGLGKHEGPPPASGQRVKAWLGKLVEDPIGTLVESAVWIFMLAIGLSLLALFARMGWDMIRQAWK